MDHERVPATDTPQRSERRRLDLPMAQQRTENYATSTPQSLVRLIGCHDPAKRKLPGKPDSRSAVSKSPIE